MRASARLTRSVGALALAGALAAATACTGSGDADSTSTTTGTTQLDAPASTAIAPTTTPPTTTPPITAAATTPPSTAPDDTTPDGTVPDDTAVGDTVANDPTAVDWTGIVSDLYRQILTLPMSPTPEAVAAVCLPDSLCDDEQSATVEFLNEAGVTVAGGPELEITAVDFQDTLDGLPLAEALDVTVIVRVRATSVEASQLIAEDGSVVSTIPPDPGTVAGGEYSQAVSLGRVSPADPWLISALGTLG